MKDSDKFPIKLTGKTRCQALSEDGDRCLRKARYRVLVFERQEFGGRWFVVDICKNHASGDFCEVDQIRQLEATA